MKRRLNPSGLGAVLTLLFLASAAEAQILTLGSMQGKGAHTPIPIVVDENFGPGTPGWGTYAFDKIQDGVDACRPGGSVLVHSGDYTENVAITTPLSLIGEAVDTTFVRGGHVGDVIHVGADSVTVTGFTVSESGTNADDACIEVGGDSCVIGANVIGDGAFGIYLESSQENAVLENSIGGCGIGVGLENSTGSLVMDNLIVSCGAGIHLAGSTGNQVNQNQVAGSSAAGIMLTSWSDSNTIDSNQLLGHVNGVALWIEYSSANTIIQNLVQYNGIGIYSVAASGNALYHNVLQINVVQAMDSGVNTWDSGYPGGGNFWSNYGGEDADGDGIGDTPQPIAGGSNLDHYPLTEPRLGTTVIAYVDQGFDQNTNGWGIWAFDNVQAGVDAVAESGSVFVYAGTYYENVVVNKSLRLIGSSGVVIDASGLGPALAITADDVEVIRIDFWNGSGGGVYVEAAGVSVTDCEFHGNDDGLLGYLANGVSADACLFDGNGYGIRLQQCESSYLLNNDVQNNLYGICLVTCSGAVLAGNTIVSQGASGLVLEGCIDAVVGSGLFESNASQAIQLLSTTDSSIHDNTLEQNGTGLASDTLSSGNRIYHNTFTSNGTHATDDGANQWDDEYPSGGNSWGGVSIPDVDLDGIGDVPYPIPGAGGNQDRYPLVVIRPPPADVWVDDNFSPATPGYGLTHFSTISGGVEACAEFGTVYVYAGSYSEKVVVNKTLTLTGQDRTQVVVDGGGGSTGSTIFIAADDCVVSGFKAQHSGSSWGAGIYLKSNGNLITDNICYGNNDGIWLNTRHNNTISYNVLEDNDSGIDMLRSTHNLFIHNDFISNRYGLELRESSAFNTIHHNNFFSNSTQAKDTSVNTWDDGSPSGGNHYSNHTGPDGNGDGFVDDPYEVPYGSNQDNYPFVNPVTH
ncbi:MAG: NosD domain-containing protein [Planctomycetota bacterium]